VAVFIALLRAIYLNGTGRLAAAIVTASALKALRRSISSMDLPFPFGRRSLGEGGCLVAWLGQ